MLPAVSRMLRLPRVAVTATSPTDCAAEPAGSGAVAVPAAASRTKKRSRSGRIGIQAPAVSTRQRSGTQCMSSPVLAHGETTDGPAGRHRGVAPSAESGCVCARAGFLALGGSQAPRPTNTVRAFPGQLPQWPSCGRIHRSQWRDRGRLSRPSLLPRPMSGTLARCGGRYTAARRRGQTRAAEEAVPARPRPARRAGRRAGDPRSRGARSRPSGRCARSSPPARRARLPPRCRSCAGAGCAARPRLPPAPRRAG